MNCRENRLIYQNAGPERSESKKESKKQKPKPQYDEASNEKQPKTEYHVQNERVRTNKDAESILRKMGNLLKEVILTAVKEVPGLELLKLVGNKYSGKELLEFMEKANTPQTKALLIQYLSGVSDGGVALSQVQQQLKSDDSIVYTSALAFMIKYGEKEDIPMYLKNINDVLVTVQKAETKAVSEYDDKVAVSRERAKKVGTGEKAYLLIDMPEDRKDLLLQYAALTGGYGSALKRGYDVLPTLKNIFEKSELGVPMLMVGVQMIEAFKFTELKSLLTSSKNKTQQNAILAVMAMCMFQSPASDKDVQAERVRAIQTISSELLASDVKFDPEQKKILEKMKAK